MDQEIRSEMTLEELAKDLFKRLGGMRTKDGRIVRGLLALWKAAESNNQEEKIKALIAFYQAIPVDVLQMKAGNGFLDMEKVEKAVSAVELAFDGENV